MPSSLNRRSIALATAAQSDPDTDSPPSVVAHLRIEVSRTYRLLGADSRDVCVFQARSTSLCADISANRAEIVFADGTNAMNTQDRDNDMAAMRPTFYTVTEA